MELTYHKLQQLLLYPIGEAEMVSSIKRLQQGFTSDRKKIDNYLTSPALVSAYTLFYLPTNFKKFVFLLDQLEELEREEFLSCDFIDIGTGPGTYILAFLSQIKELRQKIVGVDCSSLMLAQARKCIDAFFPHCKDVILQDHFSLDVFNLENKKVLCFGHSLNEMGGDFAIDLIARLKPHYLLLIEPGTPAAFKEALNLKKWLQQAGYGNLYPCPCAVGDCPMSETDNWCHQVLSTSHHPSIERISQLVQLDRRSMPMMVGLYKRNYKEKLRKGARLIRVTRETKFSFEMELCLEGPCRLQTIEVYKKSLTKQGIKKIRALSHGVTIEFNKVRELDQKWRVELISF